MLHVLGSLSAILVLAHPTLNVFTAPRPHAIFAIVLLLIWRIASNKCKHSRANSIGNILRLAAFITLICVFTNPKYFGLYIFAFGQLLNFAVILFNLGRMPVDSSKLEPRGIKLLPDSPLHVREDERTRFKLLDDRIYVPLLSEKITSIGDIFIDIGIVVTAVRMYLF